MPFYHDVNSFLRVVLEIQSLPDIGMSETRFRVFFQADALHLELNINGQNHSFALKCHFTGRLLETYLD